MIGSSKVELLYCAVQYCILQIHVGQGPCTLSCLAAAAEVVEVEANSKLLDSSLELAPAQKHSAGTGVGSVANRKSAEFIATFPLHPTHSSAKKNTQRA